MVGTYLVDVERQMVVWQYQVAERALVACEDQPQDGRYWFIFGGGSATAPQPVLASVILPHGQAKQAFEHISARDAVVLGPGSKVTIEAPSGVPDAERDRVLSSLADHLKEAGMLAAPDQPVKLNSTIKVVESKQVPFEMTSYPDWKTTQQTGTFHIYEARLALSIDARSCGSSRNAPVLNRPGLSVWSKTRRWIRSSTAARRGPTADDPGAQDRLQAGVGQGSGAVHPDGPRVEGAGAGTGAAVGTPRPRPR